MPYLDMPWVRAGSLVIRPGHTIVIDTADWFDWLTSVSAFCYSCQSSSVRLTVRQEKRGAHFYWYGYSRIDGKLHNSYLGKVENLTQERLEEACQMIYQQACERRSHTLLTDDSP